MGASESSQKTNQQTLNDVTTQVMASLTSSGGSSTSSTNTLTISGNTGSDISDITQSNVSKINMSMMATLTANNKLQTELTNALTSKISQDQDTFGISMQKSDIQNKVQTVVNTKITNDSVSSLINQVTLQNNLTISDNDKTRVARVKQENQNEAVMTMVTGLTSELMSQLGISNTSTVDSSQKSTNPLSDLMNSGILPLIIVAVALCCLGAALFFGAGKILKAVPSVNEKNLKIAMYILIAIAVVCLVAAGIVGIVRAVNKSDEFHVYRVPGKQRFIVERIGRTERI
jgi:uncharacterized Tic20 family protein